MDSLTHVLTGAVIGEATLGKKIGSKAMIWGSIISSMPDFDVFISPFLNPVDALFFHRGITHSIFFIAIISPVLAWLLKKTDKNNSTTLKDWLNLVLFALLFHIGIDCFNTYGTGILEPFSRIRVSYDSMSIIDIIIITLSFLFIVAIVLFRKENKIRRVLAWSNISFVVLYVILSIFLKMHIENTVNEQLKIKEIKYQRLLTTPLPLTSLMWRIIVEDSSGYYTSNISILDNKRDLDFRYVARNDDNIKSIIKTKEISGLIKFTKGFYITDSIATNRVNMYDLRFGGLDFNVPDSYVFTFQILKKNNGFEVSRSHPQRKINLKTTGQYFKRVFSRKE